jgi:hypothetical protein
MQVQYQNGERLIRRVSLDSITISHNPRNPAPELIATLPELGYNTPIQFAQLGLSDDEKDRATYVRTLDKYESYADGIVPLAESRRQKEIQPVLLRDFRSVAGVNPDGSKVYETRYGIVAGERRFLAAVYNFAKYGERRDIGADVRKLTVEQAVDLAFAENVMRRNPHRLEVGEFLHERRQEKNSATNKNWTIAELARRYNLPYQEAVMAEALAYLPDGDKKRLMAGKIGLTAASRKGLAIKQGKDPSAPISDKKSNRRRVKPLAEVRSLFDNPPVKGVDKQSAYRQALADVMGIPLDKAMEEFEVRESEKARKDS